MISVEENIGGINIIKIVMEESDFSSQELITERLSICSPCEFVSADKQSCSKCSCLLANRTKYAESFCPEGKW